MYSPQRTCSYRFVYSDILHKCKKRKWFFALESSNSSKFDQKVWYDITNINYQREEIQFTVNLQKCRIPSLLNRLQIPKFNTHMYIFPSIVILCIHSKRIKVVLGGGRKNFFPEDIPDVEYPNNTGKRLDGRNLTQVRYL